MPQVSITSEIKLDSLSPDSDNFYTLSSGPDDLLALTERFGWVSVDHLAGDFAFEKWLGIVGM